MNNTITTNLNPATLQFIKTEAKKHKTTQRRIIEEGIRYYKKEQLKKQVKEAFALHGETDRSLVAEMREVAMLSLKL